MNTYTPHWIENEYIRLAILADQLIGKGKIVDFYYGELLPERDNSINHSAYLIKPLEQLLKSAQSNLDDSPPFYYKTVLPQQIQALSAYLQFYLNDDSHNPREEKVLGMELFPPDLVALQKKLTDSLNNADFSGTTEGMLQEWQRAGSVDVFTFIELARAGIPQMWEDVRPGFLNSLITEEEIDLLQERSRINLAYQNNLWDDQPYYGGYRGNYLSMFCLNARLLWNRFTLKTFMACELLPGRHLFWLLRQRLYELQELPALSLLGTLAGPEKSVQEGLIACAPEFVWPQGFKDPQEQIAWEHQRLQNAVGLTASLKLWQHKELSKTVQDFIQKQAYLPPGRAAAMLKIIQENPYHYTNIYGGYQLIKELWQNNQDRFHLELIRYRCPALLQRLYPLSKEEQVATV